MNCNVNFFYCFIKHISDYRQWHSLHQQTGLSRYLLFGVVACHIYFHENVVTLITYTGLLDIGWTIFSHHPLHLHTDFIEERVAKSIQCCTSLLLFPSVSTPFFQTHFLKSPTIIISIGCVFQPLNLYKVSSLPPSLLTVPIFKNCSISIVSIITSLLSSHHILILPYIVMTINS